MTALRAEGCGGGFAAIFIKKGRGSAAGCIEGLRKKVLRIDGPFRAQGFLSLTGPLAPRVADCRSAAMLIKSALRDCRYGSYSLIRILLTGSLRSPPPIRLRRTSPASRGRINRSMLSCRDMAPLLSTHSPPAGGKVVAPATKRGAFPSPTGRLYGFIQTGAFYNLEALHHYYTIRRNARRRGRNQQEGNEEKKFFPSFS